MCLDFSSSIFSRYPAKALSVYCVNISQGLNYCICVILFINNLLVLDTKNTTISYKLVKFQCLSISRDSLEVECNVGVRYVVVEVNHTAHVVRW